MEDSMTDDEFDSGLDDAALLDATAKAEDAMFADFDESLLLRAVELSESAPQLQTSSIQSTSTTIASSQRTYQTTVDRFFSQSGSITSSHESNQVTSSAMQTSSPVHRQDSSRNPFSTTISAPAPQTPPPPPPEDAPCAHFFDPEACTTWVYPINYPLRTYQFNIVQRALFNNTLVAMPTGLGKTFIAAVVMYNYFRWFPTAKIVFMAPTKPLVNQQIEACFKICGVPQDQTAELTGAMPAAKRRLLWTSKRLFFVTPQILQNDITEGVFPVERLACLVIDEAHKATGGYAYAVAVRKIQHRHKEFRILALTATPGTNLQTVQKIVDNLLITNIQIRTEDSLDIQEFSHGKSIQTIVVSLTYTHGGVGMLPKAVSTYREKVFLPVLKTLNQFKAINDIDPDRNTPYMLMQSRGIWQSNCKHVNKFVQNTVFSNFLAADVLSRAHDLLCQHGTGPFLRSMKSTIADIQSDMDNGKHVAKSKVSIVRNPDLQKLLQDLERMHERPDYVGHPKLDRLLSAVLQHLTAAEQAYGGGSNAPTADTRIMIFSSLRESVNEIVSFLSGHEPLVRCTSFVGQAESKGSKGLNQKAQQEVISKFKRGVYNVIVSTSIGEEGLDIGEVDLIICYDSQSSPIRMIQRLGRTGRKRKGRCVLLMTETEERKYKSAKDNYKRVQDMISRRDAINYYPNNPVILPGGIRPVPDKVVLDIGEYRKLETGKRKRNATSDEFRNDGSLGESQEEEFRRRYLQPLRQREQTDASLIDEWMHGRPRLAENKYISLQTTLNRTKISHSIRSVQLAELVSKMERRILHGSNEDEEDKVHNDYKGSFGASAGTALLLPQRRKNRKLADNSDTSVSTVGRMQNLETTSHHTISPHQELAKDISMMESNDSVQTPQDVEIDCFAASPLRQPTTTDIAMASNYDAVEDRQRDTHEKPSFIFVPPDDSSIFGNHVMESPIKHTSHPQHQEKVFTYKAAPENSGAETPASNRFMYNDHMVPLFAFEMDNRIRSKCQNIPESLSWLLNDPDYSLRAHETVTQKWDALFKSGDYSLKALEEALKHVSRKKHSNIINAHTSQSIGSCDLFESNGKMGHLGYEQAGDSREKYTASTTNRLDHVERNDRAASAVNGEDDDDEFEFDLGELDLDDNTEILINRYRENEALQQTHIESITADKVQQRYNENDTQCNAQSRGPKIPVTNVTESDDDCYEIDLADLDLTMLENKFDLEGGYIPPERSPPFRLVHNIPEIITLSSDSDASGSDDHVSETHPMVSSSVDVPGLDEPSYIPSTPKAQIRTSQMITNAQAGTNRNNLEQSPLLEISDQGSSPNEIRRASLNTQPILMRRNTNTTRRNRILYSSPTEKASSPLQNLHSDTLADTAEDESHHTQILTARKNRLHHAQAHRHNPFLDMEASESGDTASSDVDDEMRSSFLDSFIDDNTITSKSETNSPMSSNRPPTNMYAVYRQSLISPDQTEGNGTAKNIFRGTKRPRYLQRVLENLDGRNMEEQDSEQGSSMYGGKSEQLTSEVCPDSQYSIASVHSGDQDDSDFM